MRSLYKKLEKDGDCLGGFSKRTYILRKVQKGLGLKIRNQAKSMAQDFEERLKVLKDDMSIDDLTFIESELASNLMELELKINTAIMNMGRITGVRISYKDDRMEGRSSFLRRGQIYFLLNQEVSQVYGQTLVYLEEELKKELASLEHDLKEIMEKMEAKDYTMTEVKEVSNDYFRINSDLNQILDDINEAVENIYDNISSNRNMSINLSFLLISAFLSIILFFPEFNNMLNLREEELSYEDRIDEIIYEKLIEEVDLDELLDLKYNRESEDILDELEDQALKEIIKNNIDYENDKLELEKNRIRVFVTILMIILIPWILWVIFIVL